MTASGFTVCDLRQTQIDFRNQHWAPELWPQSPISAPQAINRIMFPTCTLYTAEFMEGVSLTLLSLFRNFYLSQALVTSNAMDTSIITNCVIWEETWGERHFLDRALPAVTA